MCVDRDRTPGASPPVRQVRAHPWKEQPCPVLSLVHRRHPTGAERCHDVRLDALVGAHHRRPRAHLGPGPLAVAPARVASRHAIVLLHLVQNYFDRLLGLPSKIIPEPTFARAAVGR